MITNKNEQFNSYQYLGAIHIHSTFSDGSGDVDTISKAAKKAGLDWIIITDHNSLGIKEGFYKGVCVIKGEEISPKGANHYLALGINDTIEPTTPSRYVSEVREQGGFGFVAHPDESQTRNNNHNPIRWLNKNIRPDGIEIWNWFSQWADNLNERNIFGLIYAFLFRNELVTSPSLETLEWWDKLNNENKNIIPAICGVDAHALKINKYILPVTIFPYEKMFKTLTNVLTFEEPLSENFNTRKSQILEAIKTGNNLIVNRNINTTLPEIGLTNKNLNFIGGRTYKLDDFTCLTIKTSEESLIKVIHNGKEFFSRMSCRCHLLLKEVGKYRVEIKSRNRGFVYTNPILVY